MGSRFYIIYVVSSHIMLYRCKDGYLKIWDGSRGTGRHMFPPSSFCGHYGDINVINVQRISTGPNSDMDFYVSGVTSVASFRVEVTYINYGEDDPALVRVFSGD